MQYLQGIACIFIIVAAECLIGASSDGWLLGQSSSGAMTEDAACHRV